MAKMTLKHLNKRAPSSSLVFFFLLAMSLLVTTELFAAAPQVTEVYPINGGENVPLNISPRVTFNLDMDKSSFDDPGAITIIGPNFSSVPFNKSWDGNKTIILSPTQGFAANTTYAILVRGSGVDGTVVGVKDTNGNEMEDNFLSNFQTGGSIAASTDLNQPYVIDLNRDQALNLIQQRFIQFQPSGYAENVQVPPEHVVMPLADFLKILNNLPPNFDLNSIKPITSGGETSIPTSSENFTSGTSMWLGEGIYQGSFNVQGKTFNMPIYVEPNPLINQ